MQPIDLVQPVAHHGDADRDRHRRLHSEEKADHGFAGPRRTRGPRQGSRRPPTGSAARRTPARAAAAARSPWSACSEPGPPLRRRRGSRTRTARPWASESREPSGSRNENGFGTSANGSSSCSASTSTTPGAPSSRPRRARTGATAARKPAVRKHERDGQRPGEEDRPQRGDERRPRAAGKRPRMCFERHPRIRRCRSTTASDRAPHDEDPADRVARSPRHDQRAHDGRRRHRCQEQRIEPDRARTPRRAVRPRSGRAPALPRSGR